MTARKPTSALTAQGLAARMRQVRASVQFGAMIPPARSAVITFAQTHEHCTDKELCSGPGCSVDARRGRFALPERHSTTSNGKGSFTSQSV